MMTYLTEETLLELKHQHDAQHGTLAFLAATHSKKKKERAAAFNHLLGDSTHSTLQNDSKLVARQLRMRESSETLKLRNAVCALTGASNEDIEYVLAMLGLPGGLHQLVHIDGGQKNCAVMIALEDGTQATRFVSADLRSAQRGGQELERLASAQTCADLPEGKVMCAGEALLFNTAWWHAGPGQPAGSDCRRVIFIPLTGGTKRRSSQTERKPKRPRRNL